MKKIVIEFTEEEYKNLQNQLNGKHCNNYFIGGMDTDEKLKAALLNLDELCHSYLQLDYLECNGVDNWSEYSHYEYADEDEED